MQCDNKEYKDRVHRIAGQVNALEDMFESKRSAQEIMQQVLAIRASLSSLASFIVDAEVKGCLPKDESGEPVSKLVESILKIS